MATRIEELYEQDFYAWTQAQAAALRRLGELRPNLDLDFPHLIEEVADLGTSQRDTVRSQLRRIIEHCLKLEYSRAGPRRPARHSKIEARASSTTSSAPRCGTISSSICRAYGPRPATRPTTACAATGSPTPPISCRSISPTLLDDLLTDAWYPSNRRGLPDDR